MPTIRLPIRALVPFAVLVMLLGCAGTPAPTDSPADQMQTAEAPAEQVPDAESSPAELRPADQPAGGPYQLGLRPVEGAVYFMETSTVQRVEQSLMGIDIEIDQMMNATHRYEVQSLREDGTFDLNLAYGQLDYEMAMYGPEDMQESFAVGSAEMEEQVEASAGLLEGLTMRLTVTPLGHVTSIDAEALLSAIREPLSRLPEESAGTVEAAIAPLIGDEFIANSWDQYFGYVTSEPVALGESWERTFDMQSVFPMMITTHYTLVEVTEDEYVISIQGTVVAGDGGLGGMVGIGLADESLTVRLSGTQTGELRASRDTGWINSLTLFLGAEGKIMFGAAGLGRVKLPMKLESLSEVRS
jgi:uncharacterized protein DUF6263